MTAFLNGQTRFRISEKQSRSSEPLCVRQRFDGACLSALRPSLITSLPHSLFLSLPCSIVAGRRSIGPPSPPSHFFSLSTLYWHPSPTDPGFQPWPERTCGDGFSSDAPVPFVAPFRATFDLLLRHSFTNLRLPPRSPCRCGLIRPCE